MLRNLRRYEVQAGYALVLVTVSLLPCAVALWLSWRNFDMAMGRIIYGSRGRFLIAFAACIVLSLLPAAVGFVLGMSSAGQRRNVRSRQSWLAFFIGGGVVTVDVILLIAFYMLRLERPV